MPRSALNLVLLMNGSDHIAPDARDVHDPAVLARLTAGASCSQDSSAPTRW